MTDRNQTAEIFTLIKVGELRPFKQLVELYSAELDSKYVSNYTPLMEAVFLQKEDFVHYICTHMKKKYAANMGKYKSYINATSSDGKTALIIATLGNSEIKIIEYLLKNGANANHVDLHGKTAKDYCPYSVSEEVEAFWLNFKI